MDSLQEPEQAEQSVDAAPPGVEAGEGEHTAGSSGATLEGTVDSLTLAELQQQAAELGAAAGAMESWAAVGLGAPFWGMAIPIAVMPYQMQQMPDDPNAPLEAFSAADALRGTLHAAIGGGGALEAGGSSMLPTEAVQFPAAGAAAAGVADPGLWLPTEPGALLGEAVPLLMSHPLDPGPRRAAPRSECQQARKCTCAGCPQDGTVGPPSHQFLCNKCICIALFCRINEEDEVWAPKVSQVVDVCWLMLLLLPRAERRARILKDGQLTMIVYGQNEALLWAKRIASFQNAMRWGHSAL